MYVLQGSTCAGPQQEKVIVLKTQQARISKAVLDLDLAFVFTYVKIKSVADKLDCENVVKAIRLHYHPWKMCPTIQPWPDQQTRPRLFKVDSTIMAPDS